MNKEPLTTPTDQDHFETRELDIDAMAWRFRPLVVFVESGEDSELAEQQAAIGSRQSGLDERDMVVIEAIGDTVTVDGQAVAADVAALRTRYGVTADQGFVVLLIGKDTSVKLRRTRPVAMDEVFALIDTMPMRRREMRKASE